MGKNNKDKKKIDPEREMALKSLPPNLKNDLSEEEIEMFLTAEVWSEELANKLKEFLTSI